MKTLTCVCLPDKNSSQAIKKISQEISVECNSKRALSFVPHFTIRSEFKIHEKDIAGLKAELIKLCSHFSKINLRLSEYGFYPWRIIYLDINKTKTLQRLHNECMDVIEKYRTPWIRSIYKKTNNFKGKQKKYSLKYGYHYAYEFFSPHFTVAGHDMSEEKFQKMKRKLKKQKVNIKLEVKYLAFFDRNNENKIFLKIPLC